MHSLIERASTGYAPDQSARLMAMVCHGDAEAELPLMWHICDELVHQQFSVIVLDATKPESDANPGLAQALEQGWWTRRKAVDGSQRWQVIPAQWGIQKLAESHLEQIASELQWSNLAPNGSIVLIYGTTDVLAPLVRQTGVQPLLALSASKTSLMTSYLALKRLWVQGGVAPVLVQLLDAEADTADQQRAAAIASSLSDCAHHFLQLEVAVPALPKPLERSVELLGLVQTLLEESVTLETPWSPTPAKTGRGTQTFATRMN